MSHICVERLAAREGQRDAPKYRENRHRAQKTRSAAPLVHQEFETVERIHGRQDLWVFYDGEDAGRGDSSEPAHHPGREHSRDALGPTLLNSEQNRERNDRETHDPALREPVSDRLRSLPRGEDGDGSREARLSKEVGSGVHQDGPRQEAREATLGLPEEREERERAALPLVVRPKDDHVLDAHDEHDRPEDEAAGPIDVPLRACVEMSVQLDLVECVQGRCPYITEYDPQGRQHVPASP